MPISSIILDLLVALSSFTILLMLILSAVLHVLGGRRRAARWISNDNSDDLPYVSIIVPLCNEDPALVGELLESVSRIEWPRDRLEVLIVDDSDEKIHYETRRIAESFARRLNLRVQVIRRGTRRGYKAGALNYAMRYARGDYISVLDVDIKPRSNYLQSLYSYIERGADYAQGLTEFRPVIETLTSKIAKYQEEYLNGTVYRFYTHNVFLRGHTFIIRREVLERVGGFSESIGRLTEDVELTIRLRLNGYRGLLVPEILSEGRVAMTYGCYLLQRARWVTGSLLVLLRYLPRVLSSRSLNLRDKIEMLHSMLTRTSSLAFLLCALSPLVYYKLSLSMSEAVLNMVMVTYVVALMYLCISSRWGESGGINMINMLKAIASSLLWISTAPFILVYLLGGGKWYVTPKTLRQVKLYRPIIGIVYSMSMLMVAMLSIYATLHTGVLVLLPFSMYLLASLALSTVLSVYDLVKVYRTLKMERLES